MKNNLKTYNTFNINAKCKYFFKCSSIEEIRKCLKSEDFLNNSKLIIGEGSNILFKNNFEGFILKPELKGIKILSETSENITLKVYNGEIWDDFAQFCVNHNYYGIENLSLIPGNVGSATFQNIGAYGSEIKDVIVEVETINIQTRKLEYFKRNKCKFDYRSSIFKKKQKYIIISTTFILSKSFQPNLEYSGLRDELKDKINISAENVRNAVIKIRRAKLPNPKEIGNAGSFFKNPIVNNQKFLELKCKFDDLKYYQLPNNEYKIPAGWMIEKCGWKGKQIGNVGTYHKQALIIVNYGKATGNEIFQFSQKIKKSVFDEFGITLEEEVKII